MWFKEFLRVRTALFWYTVTLGVLAAFIAIVAVTSPKDKSTTSISHDTSGKTVITTTYESGAKSVTRSDSAGNRIITVTDKHHKVHTINIGKTPGSSDNEAVGELSGKPDDIPWVALLGAAGFVAAILATVLGSTLAVENSHLEVAWT